MLSADPNKSSDEASSLWWYLILPVLFGGVLWVALGWAQRQPDWSHNESFLTFVVAAECVLYLVLFVRTTWTDLRHPWRVFLVTTPTIVLGIALFNLVVAIPFLYVGPFGTYMSNIPEFAQASIVLTAGMLLFIFRLLLKSLYGLTEVGVGVYLGVQRLGSWSDSSPSNLLHVSPTTAVTVLVAGVYLVVRGLDNFHQATNDEKSRDLLVRALRRRRMGKNELGRSTLDETRHQSPSKQVSTNQELGEAPQTPSLR